MKHNPEDKIFYTDKYRYFSLETTAPRFAVYFLDETRYSTSIYYLVTPLLRYNIRNTPWKNRFISVNHKIYLTVCTIRILGRLNDTIFSQVGVLQILKKFLSYGYALRSNLGHRLTETVSSCILINKTVQT